MYFTPSIDSHNQISGTSKVISEHSIVTDLFLHIPKEIATTIYILKRQALPATSQLIMDAIYVNKELVPSGRKSRMLRLVVQFTLKPMFVMVVSMSVAEVGDFEDKRHFNAHTPRSTITPRKHAAC
jgi:hypothetical protein